MNKKALGLLAVASLASIGFAQDVPNVGINVGVYMPTSGAVRDAFGSSILRFGFGEVGRQRTGNFRIGTSLDFITANKNGNRMLLVPFTLNAEQQLVTDEYASMRPYVKAFAGLAYMDYAVTTVAGRVDDKVVRATYGAELGIVVSDRIRLAARYNAFPKTGGLDFSGVTLSATISLLR